MSTKAEKIALVEKFASSPWWKSEYDGLFTEDITMEFPFAPPGMPQYLYTGMVASHRWWWSDTVPLYRAAVARVYPPKDPEGNEYFFISDVEGEVCWAGTEGHYTNHVLGKVTIRGDRICHYKEWSNPLEYLNAIGVQYPKFRVKAKNEYLQDYYSGKKAEAEAVEYDLSPEACEKRRYDNLTRLAPVPGEKYPNVAKRADMSHTVWFLPPDMKYKYDEHGVEYMLAWSKNNRDSIEITPDCTKYETDDPNVVFIDMGCISKNVNWAGNGKVTRYYGQRYIMHEVTDENGFLIQDDEYLNPVYKFNCICQSLPTFPYLF